jgi:hypothetical protein
VIAAALALFTFALWARRQAEPTYVPLFMWLLLWALPSANLFVRNIPMPTFYWDIAEKGAFGWGSLLSVVFVMRYLDLRWPRFEKLLAVYAALGPILMVIAGPARLHAVVNDWLFGIIAVATFFEARLVAEAWRRRKLEAAVLASVVALGIIAVTHDGLLQDALAFDRFRVLPRWCQCPS